MADSSLSLARLASQFVQTEYGKHYVERLERIRTDYRNRAESVNATESESRAFSLKASAYDDEIRYFKTAIEIASNPSIVKRLTDKLKQKGDSSV